MQNRLRSILSLPIYKAFSRSNVTHRGRIRVIKKYRVLLLSQKPPVTVWMDSPPE